MLRLGRLRLGNRRQRPTGAPMKPCSGKGLSPTIDFVAKRLAGQTRSRGCRDRVTLIPALAAAGTRPDITIIPLDSRNVPPRAVYAATP